MTVQLFYTQKMKIKTSKIGKIKEKVNFWNLKVVKGLNIVFQWYNWKLADVLGYSPEKKGWVSVWLGIESTRVQGL